MLEWTHDSATCPRAKLTDVHAKLCTGGRDCEEFPTHDDRMNMAQAAYDAYSESDGTEFVDFLRDVVILAYRRKGMPLGDLHAQVGMAYMLANDITVPMDLEL